MGGKNETTIGGLRLHESAGEVHVHDDGKSVKFIMDALTFKEEIQDALAELQKHEGIIKVNGDNSVPLYIMKDDKLYNVFVGGSGVKGELQKFFRGL